MAALPVRIGCSGWNYKDWRGREYPPGVPPRRWLAHYARDFDTARLLFDACRTELPEDRVLSVFAERSARHAEVPPPDDWDGVEVLLHK